MTVLETVMEAGIGQEADTLDVFVLPDGLGGELLSVGCDDSKLHYFQAALHAARSIAQITGSCIV